MDGNHRAVALYMYIQEQLIQGVNIDVNKISINVFIAETKSIRHSYPGKYFCCSSRKSCLPEVVVKVE